MTSELQIPQFVGCQPRQWRVTVPASYNATDTTESRPCRCHGTKIDARQQWPSQQESINTMAEFLYCTRATARFYQHMLLVPSSPCPQWKSTSPNETCQPLAYWPRFNILKPYDQHMKRLLKQVPTPRKVFNFGALLLGLNLIGECVNGTNIRTAA